MDKSQNDPVRRDGAFVEVPIGDLSVSEDIGLSEGVLAEELAMEDMERRELLVNPSDLQDVGDPEAGDVGVAGGLAAGGEMGEGGYGALANDPWGLGLLDASQPPAEPAPDDEEEEGLV
jgi:hypothetical protein